MQGFTKTDGARLLLVDNYDSFTYNLVQAFLVLGADVVVHRNDQITVAEARALEPTHVCISPGPGRPEDAGVSPAMIEAFLGELPLFGVCLGHQALTTVLGGVVDRAPRLMHGKSSMVHHDGKGVYKGLSQPFQAARYHSLMADPDKLPDSLVLTSWTEEGEVMGLRHKTAHAYGVQFHPESVLTPEGDALMANFLAFGA
ncbi:MAG: aminodeoxychorismate/anthranilate synthase component II [Deltaproteobacteria bacterium]|nr:MAG: aminodeoxychorismate/anthranilate synthase component II [Deltaproteobacteria bacterium]